MLKVMHLDLVLNRRILLINGGLMLGFLAFVAAQADMTPRFVVLAATMMFSFAPVTMLVHEDKYKGMALSCSLPVARRTIVASRYTLAMGITLGGVLCAVTLVGMLPFSRLSWSDLVTLGNALTAVAAAGVVYAFMLPFTLRFGTAGLMIFLVTMQVIGIVLFMTVQLTDSSLDRRIVGGVIQAIRDAHAGLGRPAFELALVAALGLLVTLSYALSVRLFERREL